MNTFANAMKNEAAWTETWNGADTLSTSFNKCLDLFGRGGAMREDRIENKQDLFRKAYEENPDVAMKLLFYIRDIRGGYGERDTFTDMLQWVGDHHPESVKKNFWAILEYGRAKDLYALVGTKVEADMWAYIKAQFEVDVKNMRAGNSISLLAKWIATPDAKSAKTAALGRQTAKAIGYDFKHMREYKKLLREMRRYLDIPEAKMATGKWAEIEYSKIASQCMIKHRHAFIRHDGERFSAFIDKAANGEEKINTAAMTPCDIIRETVHNYSPELDVMWQNLTDYCKGDAIVMCDTSGSMTWSNKQHMPPIAVAIALSMYFAERNKGALKDMFFSFESNPHLVEITGVNLLEKYRNILSTDWGGSTDLAAAFKLLLDICVNNKVSAEDIPDAIIIVSDMQIDCVEGIKNNRMTFYDYIAKEYEEAGYQTPQVVFWNVNAVSPAFHATADTKGVSFVSGYSPAVFKAVMENIGTTPLEMMMKVINDPRYAPIIA